MEVSHLILDMCVPSTMPCASSCGLGPVSDSSDIKLATCIKPKRFQCWSWQTTASVLLRAAKARVLSMEYLRMAGIRPFGHQLHCPQVSFDSSLAVVNSASRTESKLNPPATGSSPRSLSQYGVFLVWVRRCKA